MKQQAIATLAVELAILVFLTGSVAVLARNSRNFLLAERQAALLELQPGQPVVFGRDGDQAASLIGRWDRTKSWGALASERTATLALKLPPSQSAILTFRGRFFSANRLARRIGVALDGRAVAALSISGPAGESRCRWSIALPPPSGALSLLQFTVEPAAFSIAVPDAREQNRLMLGLESVNLQTAASVPYCENGAAMTITGSPIGGRPG